MLCIITLTLDSGLYYANSVVRDGMTTFYDDWSFPSPFTDRSKNVIKSELISTDVASANDDFMFQDDQGHEF